MNQAYGSGPDSLADTRLVEPPKANTAGIGQSSNARMAPGIGAQWQNGALTRGGNQKPMLSASGVPAMHVGLDDEPDEAVPEEESDSYFEGMSHAYENFGAVVQTKPEGNENRINELKNQISSFYSDTSDLSSEEFSTMYPNGNEIAFYAESELEDLIGKEEYQKFMGGLLDADDLPLLSGLDGYSVPYTDKETGATIYLSEDRMVSIADHAYNKYRDREGKWIYPYTDPYSNLLSVLTGAALKPGDNMIVVYAKTFVGRLPYGKDKDLGNSADCSAFANQIYDDFGITIPETTAGIAESAKSRECEDVIIGPGYIIGQEGGVLPFNYPTLTAAVQIDRFCRKLEEGDLILFNLGDRNKEEYGEVDHVVIYAGIDPDTGKHMIVESYDNNRVVYYRPITDLIFEEAGGENSNWKTRLPIYAVRYLTEEQRGIFSVSES